MPRWIDWDEKVDREADMKVFEPRYGAGELRDPKERTPQFWLNNGGDAIQESFEDIFQWLAQNCGGPWHFHEKWGNHGHSIELSVCIDQKPDQEKFRQGPWGNYFSFRDNTLEQLTRMGMAEGLIPPYTGKENIQVWCREARKRFFTFNDAPREPATITIHDDLLEAEFICAWDPIATDRPQTYLFPDSEEAYEIRQWLAGRTVVSPAFIPGAGKRIKIEINHPELLNSFRADWGRRFASTPQNPNVYEGLYPETPARVLPQRLLDYIEGRVPTLHSAEPQPPKPEP